MAFNTETTTQQWMAFLHTMSQVQLATGVHVSIHQQIPMYNSAKSRLSYLRSVKDDIQPKVESGEYTQEVGDAKIANWSRGISVTTYLSKIQSNGTLTVISNALGNASEQHSSADWHVYAIFYQQGILAIYDPSFEAGTCILDSCTGIKLAKNIVKALLGKSTNRSIRELWIGGGGNDGTLCQEMTRRWIFHEIEVMRGADLGNWEERGWTRLHF